jgi:hypothetical protein
VARVRARAVCGGGASRRPILGRAWATAILCAMGFNPYRPQRRSAADYVFVAAGLLVCAALLVWALLG